MGALIDVSAGHSNACRDDRQLDARANILGTPVDAINMEAALCAIATHMGSGRRGYVGAIGVHGILEALRDDAVARAFSASVLNVPDGTPTVWVGRLQGLRAMDHVTGPDLMLEVFSRAEFAGCSHFFYGGKPGVADELAAAFRLRFPEARIVGTYTPPFRDLNFIEEEHVISRINASGADMVWVGISTPRQELWMRRMLPFLNSRLMFGVGAAFDLHTGRIRACPQWIKRAGLHWLHRLVQDPKRLWRRNLRNSAFLWHIVLQLTGMKQFRLNAGTRINMASAHDDHRAARTYSDAADVDAAHPWHRS